MHGVGPDGSFRLPAPRLCLVGVEIEAPHALEAHGTDVPAVFVSVPPGAHGLSNILLGHTELGPEGSLRHAVQAGALPCSALQDRGSSSAYLDGRVSRHQTPRPGRQIGAQGLGLVAIDPGQRVGCDPDPFVTLASRYACGAPAGLDDLLHRLDAALPDLAGDQVVHAGESRRCRPDGTSGLLPGLLPGRRAGLGYRSAFFLGQALPVRRVLFVPHLELLQSGPELTDLLAAVGKHLRAPGVEVVGRGRCQRAAHPDDTDHLVGLLVRRADQAEDLCRQDGLLVGPELAEWPTLTNQPPMRSLPARQGLGNQRPGPDPLRLKAPAGCHDVARRRNAGVDQPRDDDGRDLFRRHLR
ncbi:MAG: hypothetical protein ACK5QX_01565, partial [bacterium]